MRCKGLARIKNIPLITFLVTACFLFVMFPTVVNAQVTIKERMELEAETDGEGQIEFDYRSSVFSGKYVFKAATFINGDSLFAENTLTIRVPDLVAFPDGDTYTLTGGGPDLHTNENIHYLVSQAAIDSLISAADAFSIASWNDEKCV